MSRCVHCGFASGTPARFCGGCGRPLAATAGVGERRQLTVLMCDLVGSTELSQSLDAEDLHELLAEYQRVCSDAVARHDGHVAQYLGDGVLIYFGFPQAHEDDAHRAVRCGLDILAGMEALNRRAPWPGGAQVRVRAGVHTGRVYVGTVGTGVRQENLAHGEVPNVGARVQAAAAPDTLVVSEAAWKIVHDHFRGEALGERRLRGVAQPMRLWRVTGVSAAGPAPGGAGVSGVFVGREREHAALATHWATARAGCGRFVTLRGEAGIGKSRLGGEFRRCLAGADVEMLELRCTPYARNSAFLPVIELVERCFGFDGTLPAGARLDRIDERLAEFGVAVAGATPLLAALLSIPLDERHPAPALSPARQRARMLEVLLDIVRSLAARRPTLLVAEDLHWADASTLELIGRLAASAGALPLLVLGLARPEFDPPWGAQPGAVLIDLPRLDGVEVEAIVRDVAHGKPVPGEVLRHIARHGDGVPLYVEESTRAVLESGVLEEHEHHWTLAGPLGSAVIPASLDASLMARIDRLGDARATAQLAATIGRSFSYALLRAVSERDEQALRDDLRQIVDAGLAWRSSTTAGETHVFKHVLVQLAAYESLLRSTRQRYHERIADVLRRDFADEARTRPEVVARHLSGAGRPAEASDYWRAAGENALARLAVPEAHGHFARGLEDLAGVPESDATLARELELQIAIAPTLMTVNGWASPTVARACERARELALRLGRPDKLYPPLWGLWTNLFVGGRLDRALDTAREVLAMAGASGVPMLLVTARHAMAYSHCYRGEWTEAIDHARAGLALYEVGQERALTATFQISASVNMVAALGSGLWMLGHQDEGLREIDRMLAMARELNHPSALANALGVACYMLTFHHDAPRMKRHADEVKGFAREEGWELWYAVGVMSSGWARLRMGEGAASLEELFEGVALFRATGSELMGPTVAVIHAEGLCAAGRPAEALAMLEETAATAQHGHVGMLLPDVHRIAGGIHLAAGALDEAEAALRRALEAAAGQQALSLELRAALALHPLLERTGRGDEARALLRRLCERFEDSHSQPELRRARALLGAAAFT